MKAIVYHGKDDFRYENTPDPKLEGENDAIVRVCARRSAARTSTSGTVACREGIGGAGGFAVGHEFLGVVEETGKGVRGVKKGDRVLVSCTVGCGSCAMCRQGVYSGCRVMTAGGGASNVFGFSPALQGGQAEAVRVPFADTNLFHVPEATSPTSRRSS